MAQQPESDKMLRKDEDVDLKKMTKDDLIALLEKKAEEETDVAERLASLEAGLADAEKRNAQLQATAKEGKDLLEHATETGELPEYEMVLIQFARDYTYGGKPTPNPKVMAHRNFSLRGGEVAWCPKKLAKEFERDFPDSIRVGEKNLKDQVVAKRAFDPETGKPKMVETTVPVSELIAKARHVGLANVR